MSGKEHLSIIFDCLRYIMEVVTNKNPKAKNGSTPLHLSAQEGHLSICELILINTEEKSPLDEFGWSPLHWAAQNGHFDVFQFVCAFVKDINPKAYDGGTPLHLSAQIGNYEISKIQKILLIGLHFIGLLKKVI